MNVLFMCRLYYPHVGGVEKHVAKVSQLLTQRGYKITVVAERHDSTLALEEEMDRVKVYRIPLPDTVGESAKKWHIWKWFLAHRGLFDQANVIHIHDVFFWFLPFRLPYWFKKVYLTFHGYEGRHPTVKQIFWHRLAALLTRGNICIGDFHRKWYGVSPDLVSYGAV